MVFDHRHQMFDVKWTVHEQSSLKVLTIVFLLFMYSFLQRSFNFSSRMIHNRDETLTLGSAVLRL